MGRPKKWASDVERMRSKRTGLSKGCSDTPVNEHKAQPQNKRTVNWQDIDPSTFDGHGNGVPVNGYVRVIRKVKATLDHDYGVVTEPDFWSRYHSTCTHGLGGWSCKPCLIF